MNGSTHYFRLKGEAAEAVVQELAVRSYFTDWCYANPRLPDGKELCDLLVVFDRVAIIWQIKNLKLGPDGRFSEREVEKNIRQLSGARRQMFDLKRPIALTNPRRGNETFDPSTIDEVYLISVLAGGTESFRAIARTIKNRTLHVFGGDFAEIVLNELDTISDFVDYLRAKEALLKNLESLTIMGGEEELLAYYLMHGRSFDDMKEFTGFVMDDGAWARLQERPEYKAKKQADEISYGWDSMIDRVHTGGTTQYEGLAREMARVNRFERRCLSKAFLEAHMKAHNDSVHDIFRRVLASKSKTYCFLFSDDPEPRTRRKAMLGAMCYVARGRFKENSTVIGIATEKMLRPTCTYDFCLLEAPSWSADDNKQMKEIQERTGLLTNTTAVRAQEDEYPRDAGQ